MKTGAWIVLLVACGAMLGYGLVARRTPEECIRRQVFALADAAGIDPTERDPRARPLRIEAAFRRVLAPRVRVEVTDLVEDVHGRDELSGMMVSAAQTFSDLSIAPGDVRVDVDPGGRSALAHATATVVGVDHDGEPIRALRDVTMSFERADGVWRLSSLTAEAPARDGEEEPAGIAHAGSLSP